MGKVLAKDAWRLYCSSIFFWGKATQGFFSDLKTGLWLQGGGLSGSVDCLYASTNVSIQRGFIFCVKIVSMLTISLLTKFIGSAH